ncbi:diacylglycerol/lipid kinase family protein [Tautonia sociabilis]|uniref:Diacylglycerol kinase family lipid kinase n=1 Tax=Tautonia sociabilis TaxID=2080755 RepID=A0A432MN62_9BACT|nr:diacylglycerol kinase family protein [Tautonia sociabilis]RUL88881.1 diacylglycerol kinase family lipid kinase [Tautonia sociabilis]
MSTEALLRLGTVFVVLNPNSGRFATEIRTILCRHFGAEADGSCRIHLLAEGQEVKALVSEAIRAGAKLVVAAGGDGTVAAVADGLIGSGVPMGVLPLGTANVLARELGLPLDPDEACAILASSNELATLDAMRVGGRPFFTQVGVGLDSLMIRDTDTESKRRLGRLAYLWTGVVRLAGFQPRRFVIRIDDQGDLRLRASQVLVANVGTLGQPPFRWGPDIRPDDGELAVCVLRARSAFDYLRLTINLLRGAQRSDPSIRYFKARKNVRIALARSSSPLPVQADGEIIGQTPVVVELIPQAVRVIVPPGFERKTPGSETLD